MSKSKTKLELNWKLKLHSRTFTARQAWLGGGRVRNLQVEANKLAQIKRHKPQVVQQTLKENFKSNSICALHLLKFFLYFYEPGNWFDTVNANCVSFS